MGMRRIRREVRALRKSLPGRRFVGAHERHRLDRAVLRLALIALGGALALAGSLTFWIPGPNFVVVIAGLALVAAQWRLFARLLDHAELALHRWHEQRWEPYPHKRRVIVVAWLAFALAFAGVLRAAAALGWLPSWLPLAG